MRALRDLELTDFVAAIAITAGVAILTYCLCALLGA